MMDYDDAWPDVSCALPDMRYAVYAIIGAVVIVAALAVVMVRKLRTW